MERDNLSLARLLIKIVFAILALGYAPALAFASGNIDPAHKYAFSNVGGYINFAPTNSGVTVSDDTVIGYAWSANDGWINFAPANGGVQNDGAGNLSGYAWDSSAGWVNFSGVTINTSTGKFAGMATGGTVNGASFRINFDCTYCDVVTTWRPASNPPAGGGSGGGGGGGAGCPSGYAWNPSTNACVALSNELPPAGTSTPPGSSIEPVVPPAEVGPPASGILPPTGSGNIPPSVSGNPAQPPIGTGSTEQAKNGSSSSALETLAVIGVIFAGLAALYTTNALRAVSDFAWSTAAWFAFFGAAKQIRKKKIGVVPTDNLYALAASALAEEAVDRVYRVKKENPTEPYDILISSVEELEQFGISLTEDQKRLLAEKYWPGPVRISFPCRAPNLAYLHRNTNSLAFRFPADFVTLSFLRKTGPVIAPSANPIGSSPATTIEEARTYFQKEVDFYINKGKLGPIRLEEVRLDA